MKLLSLHSGKIPVEGMETKDHPGVPCVAYYKVPISYIPFVFFKDLTARGGSVSKVHCGQPTWSFCLGAVQTFVKYYCSFLNYCLTKQDVAEYEECPR